MTPPAPPRARLAAAAVLVALTLSACGAQDQTAPAPTAAPTPSASQTPAQETAGMDGMDMSAGTTAPSAPAAMICSSEIVDAVSRTFALDGPAATSSRWQRPDFRCDYRLPKGSLRLTVSDIAGEPEGRRRFDDLRRQLNGATTIRGVQGFGLPGFETPRGDVVFLKDHKTLWVDAHAVAAADLPSGFTRAEAAYGVAAAVVACWSE